MKSWLTSIMLVVSSSILTKYVEGCIKNFLGLRLKVLFPTNYLNVYLHENPTQAPSRPISKVCMEFSYPSHNSNIFFFTQTPL